MNGDWINKYTNSKGRNIEYTELKYSELYLYSLLVFVIMGLILFLESIVLLPQQNFGGFVIGLYCLLLVPFLGAFYSFLVPPVVRYAINNTNHVKDFGFIVIAVYLLFFVPILLYGHSDIKELIKAFLFFLPAIMIGSISYSYIIIRKTKRF